MCFPRNRGQGEEGLLEMSGKRFNLQESGGKKNMLNFLSYRQDKEHTMLERGEKLFEVVDLQSKMRKVHRSNGSYLSEKSGVLAMKGLQTSSGGVINLTRGSGDSKYGLRRENPSPL